jgi:hypothetical protein
MARKPYRTARQEHLGDALDDLGERQIVEWRWAYDEGGHRAVYHVRRRDECSCRSVRTGARTVGYRSRV